MAKLGQFPEQLQCFSYFEVAFAYGKSSKDGLSASLKFIDQAGSDSFVKTMRVFGANSIVAAVAAKKDARVEAEANAGLHVIKDAILKFSVGRPKAFEDMGVQLKVLRLHSGALVVHVEGAEPGVDLVAIYGPIYETLGVAVRHALHPAIGSAIALFNDLSIPSVDEKG